MSQVRPRVASGLPAPGHQGVHELSAGTGERWAEQQVRSGWQLGKQAGDTGQVRTVRAQGGAVPGVGAHSFTWGEMSLGATPA